MKRRYQIEQQRAVNEFRQLATKENPNIQMALPLSEIVGLLQQGVGHLLREAGLALMGLVREEEVRHVAGERHRTSNTRSGERIAGARRTATVSLTGRKYRSRGRGCERKRSANSGWGVMNYSSAAGLWNKGCGTRWCAGCRPGTMGR